MPRIVLALAGDSTTTNFLARLSSCARASLRSLETVLLTGEVLASLSDLMVSIA